MRQPQEGSAIYSWKDINHQSKKRNAVQTIFSQRPTYVREGINGLPVINFDGTDDFLAVNEIANVALSPYTVITVIRTEATSGGVKCPISWNNDTTFYGNAVVLCFDSADGEFSKRNDSNTLDLIESNLNNQNIIISLTQDQTTVKTYKNGVLEGIDSDSLVANSTLFSIGMELDQGTEEDNFFQGKIAEIIVYSRVLKAEERSSIEKYLSSKWNINLD